MIFEVADVVPADVHALFVFANLYPIEKLVVVVL
jgi:hypothetical protein